MLCACEHAHTHHACTHAGTRTHSLSFNLLIINMGYVSNVCRNCFPNYTQENIYFKKDVHNEYSKLNGIYTITKISSLQHEGLYITVYSVPSSQVKFSTTKGSYPHQHLCSTCHDNNCILHVLGHLSGQMDNVACVCH